jgi:hypothetical protein
MKKKNIISLSIAFAFVVLGTSGILLYIKQKPHFVEMTHTIFGLIFFGFAIFHIVNNWGSLKNYSKDKTTGAFKKELLVASIIGLIVLTLSVTEVLEPVAEFGRIFAPKRGPRPDAGISFQEKTTLDSTNGVATTFILQKVKDQEAANLNIEVVDSTGKVLETLYTTDKEAKGPGANLILSTKISTPAPFKIIITGISSKKTEEEEEEGKPGIETKTQETYHIQALNPGAQVLNVADSKLLKRAIIEIK